MRAPYLRLQGRGEVVVHLNTKKTPCINLGAGTVGFGARGLRGGYSQGGRRPQPTASAAPAAQPSSCCRCDAAKARTRAVACSACAAGPTLLPRHLTAVLGGQQPMAPGPGAEVSAGSGLPHFLHGRRPQKQLLVAGGGGKWQGWPLMS